MGERIDLYERIKGIYLIERIAGPSEGPKYYVGQASNLFERLNQHSTFSFGDAQAIDRLIRDLTPTAFRYQVLEEVSDPDERDARERHWINHYAERFGVESLFNRQTGGKRGSVAIPNDTAARERRLKAAIRGVFQQDIGFPVYLVAEHFGVGADLVIAQRKSILKAQGLKYDMSSKKVVHVESGVAVDGWRGGVLTQRQVDLFCELHGVLSSSEMLERLQITSGDLKNFAAEFSSEYRAAEDVSEVDIVKAQVQRLAPESTT